MTETMTDNKRGREHRGTATHGSIRVGLLVNPVAGLGARVALHGSDGDVLQAEARRRGGEPRARQRAHVFLSELTDLKERFNWYSWGGLGAECLDVLQMRHTCLGKVENASTATDTQTCVQRYVNEGLDLIIFVGGDGTAVDIYQQFSTGQNSGLTLPLCLGIPAGVKMHSGAFAVSPQAAAHVLRCLVNGKLVGIIEADVVDFEATSKDAEAIQISCYGQLKVPEIAGFLQHTKEGGRESEPLVLEEICADGLARFTDVRPLIFGPGGTMLALKQAFGLASATLRGFDVLLQQDLCCLDATSADLERLAGDAHLFLSFTRRQGFLLGRGNLELSPKFLQTLPRNQLEVFASRSKVLSLQGKPVLVDCGDIQLDKKFSGLTEITAGYEDKLLYQVQAASLLEDSSPLVSEPIK